MNQKNRTIIASGAALLALVGVGALWQQGYSAPASKGSAKTSATVPGAPAGEYSCMKSRMTYSAIKGPGGMPMMVMQYDASVLGTIRLDGKGNYSASKKPGRYVYNAQTRKFAFTSGPLKDWPVVYQVSSGTPKLRLAAVHDGQVGASLKTGEHVCSLRGNRKYPDLAAGVSGNTPPAKPAAARNAGARGTLTFREEWGSGKIVDVKLPDGAVQSRFEGRHPFRSTSGGTVFLNGNGALVIAAATGTAITTVPLKDVREIDSPVLSPDGSKIAFHVEPVYYDSRVVVVSRDGKKLAEFKEMTEPDWTPDGRLVMAKRTGTENARAGIYLSDAGLNTLKRIDPRLDDVQQPAVSPDGKQVAVVSHGHIWLMNLDGSGLKQLTRSDNGEERPAWSPDGRWLVVAKQERGEVVLVSVPSGKMTLLEDKAGRVLQSSGRLNWR